MAFNNISVALCQSVSFVEDTWVPAYKNHRPFISYVPKKLHLKLDVSERHECPLSNRLRITNEFQSWSVTYDYTLSYQKSSQYLKS